MNTHLYIVSVHMHRTHVCIRLFVFVVAFIHSKHACTFESILYTYIYNQLPAIFPTWYFICWNRTLAHYTFHHIFAHEHMLCKNNSERMWEICWGFASWNAFTLIYTCALEIALLSEVRTPSRGGRVVVVYTLWEASHGALQITNLRDFPPLTLHVATFVQHSPPFGRSAPHVLL